MWDERVVDHGDNLIALVTGFCCFLTAPTDGGLFGMSHIARIDANERKTGEKFGGVGEGGVVDLTITSIAEVFIGLPELCIGITFYGGVGVVGLLPGFLLSTVIVIAWDDEDRDACGFHLS